MDRQANEVGRVMRVRAAIVPRRVREGIRPLIDQAIENPTVVIMPNGLPIWRVRRYWSAYGFLPVRDVSSLYYQVMEVLLHRRINSRLPRNEQGIIARLFIALQHNLLLVHPEFELRDISNPQERERVARDQNEIEREYRRVIPNILNFLNYRDIRDEERLLRERARRERRARRVPGFFEVPGFQSPKRGGFGC